MLGEKLKTYRLSRGWTLDRMAEAVAETGMKISKTALSKFERNIISPTPSTLLHIAQALDCDPLAFIASDDYKIVPLHFRKKTSLKASDMNRMRGLCQTELEKYAWLQEKVIPEQVGKNYLSRNSAASVDEAEEKAAALREVWNLGNYPIENLTKVLEENGIFVYEIDAPEAFDGYSVLLKDNKGKIINALTASNIHHTGERQRFSLAHELAHILIVNDDPKLNEKLAHRFASAFLLPADEVRRMIGVRRTRLTISELLSYKRYFKASMQAIVYRMKDLDIITESYYFEIFKYFSAHNLRKSEPEPLEREKPGKIALLVERAAAEGHITPEDAERKFDMAIKPDEAKELSEVQRFLKLPKDEKEAILAKQLEEANEYYKEDTFLKELRETELD